MAQIDITSAVETYVEAVGDEGAWSWNTPQKGITVPSDVKDAMELLHEVLAGATITVSRVNDRITSISVTSSGSEEILSGLEEKLDEAIESHDDLEEQDGYCP